MNPPETSEEITKTKILGNPEPSKAGNPQTQNTQTMTSTTPSTTPDNPWINIRTAPPAFNGEDVTKNIYIVWGYRGPQIARLFFDGHFERMPDGKTDLGVTHWMPVIHPPAPSKASDGGFSTDQQIIVPTACCKPPRLMTLQVHHEPDGVRVRLVDGEAATWWEFLKAPSVRERNEVR